VLCRIGLIVKPLFDCQYRLCLSAGECNHDVLLPPLYFRKSANIKPILQDSVLASLSKPFPIVGLACVGRPENVIMAFQKSARMKPVL